MKMDDRKKMILRAIIDDYIDTAEPIGSRTIARKHELGLSSATIRNEMADLEELGFLEQPHTSAGRIPSHKGYRFYVDSLMEQKTLSTDDINSIKGVLEVRINEMSQLIRHAALIISRITRYTSIAVTPDLNKVTVKAVQVVPIEPGRALVIVVLNGGIIRNCMVEIPGNYSPDQLINISNRINEKIAGKASCEIKKLQSILSKSFEGVGSDILKPVIEGIIACTEHVSNEVYLEGTSNIFNYPEFRDFSKAREFITLLDAKELVGRLLKSCTDSEELSIHIGSENEMIEIKDMSLITTNYNMSNSVLGTIGIIGPTRMEYSRVISAMRYVRIIINDEIARIISEL